MTVSVIIVNYFSSATIKMAINSIVESSIDYEIFVVDNSCNMEEIKSLKDALPQKVKLICNKSNVGFAKACNQAYKNIKGKYILLLNPDAYLLKGALEKLCDFLEKKQDAAAVSPMSFWDDEKSFILPPSHMPNPFYDLVYSGQYKIPLISPLFYLRWRYKSIKTSLSKNALIQDNLSGGGVLIKRDAITKVDGLFDESYFLYYEDSDLFKRLKKKGYKLFIEPNAQMVHHWNQSPEPQDSKAKLYAESNHIFMKKHYPILNKFKNIAKGLLQLNHSEPTKIYDKKDMLSGIPIPNNLRKRYLFEWSPNKSLFPAMLHFSEGKYFKFSDKTFSLLRNGVYYGRFSDPNSFVINNNYFAWILD
ncbi:MAG: glycosyltransferase family 2 protein [Thermodesulfovibrionales bacterium]|nr:glycosyltransferase family 2 protein [Thermodesulfovibrionales bacterium]